jgi:hypothetical protein
LKYNVGIIGIKGIPSDYGGFETFVESWMNNTNRKDQFVVYCERNYRKIESVGGVMRKFVPLSANGFSSLLYDGLSMLHACFFMRANCLVVLGVSGSWFFPIVKIFSPTTKIVVNIDGLEWRRNKWSVFQKRLLKILERIAVSFADEIVVDNQALSAYVFDEYQVNSVTIAYGYEHCSSGTEYSVAECDRYYLSICRIEPENNCELILDTFSKNNLINLIFVGNWMNSSYSRKLFARYSEFSNIKLIGPEFDKIVLSNLRANCYAYIHGHTAGGTNPSLVEMLQYGKNIIAHDNEFNRWTLDNRGSYFKHPEDLISQLNSDFSAGEDWSELMRMRYSWRQVIDDYEALCFNYLEQMD